jgi:Uncharacterized conserved protein
MKLRVLDEPFTVCKVASVSRIPFHEDFVFVGKTDKELSLVCRTPSAPQDCTEREDGWRAFRVEEKMDFSLVGILSGISASLAAAGISIFAVSTFDADYILVKEEKLAQAVVALEAAGYEFASR